MQEVTASRHFGKAISVDDCSGGSFIRIGWHFILKVEHKRHCLVKNVFLLFYQLAGVSLKPAAHHSKSWSFRNMAKLGVENVIRLLECERQTVCPITFQDLFVCFLTPPLSKCFLQALSQMDLLDKWQQHSKTFHLACQVNVEYTHQPLLACRKPWTQRRWKRTSPGSENPIPSAGAEVGMKRGRGDGVHSEGGIRNKQIHLRWVGFNF